MGAMKAIYTDIQELHHAAVGDEDSFITYIEEMGWMSPSEKEARTFQASKLVMDLSPEERATVSKVLSAVGFHIPAVDFPIGTVMPLAILTPESTHNSPKKRFAPCLQAFSRI